jgi:hypothetical protein
MIARRIFVATAVAGLWIASHLGAAEPAARPNIIVILSDDMGYSDLGCYGGEIQTPNLDRLAAGGLRFTQFYNTARCCPTRAALLTGLYSHQAGMGHMTEDKGFESYRGDLKRRCVTIAEALTAPSCRREWSPFKSHRKPSPTTRLPTQVCVNSWVSQVCGYSYWLGRP